MIIVSQDKKRIVDLTGKDIEINNPKTWNQGFWSIDTYPNCNDSQKYHLRLGVYKTEERAKEVLQEIIKCYKDTNYEYENCWCLRNLVYEMPEE